MDGRAVGVIESGSLYFIRTDWIGGNSFATNGAGTKVWEATYLPFGGVHTSAGTPLELRFPGQWFQSESGLHQNWMREYDPTTGRYIQADPLGLVDGASVYGYAGQNPGRFFDPRGEAYFALRPLDNLPWTPWSDSAWLWRLNIEFSHEQLFFEDGKSPSNLGFFEDSLVRPDRPHLFSEYKRARIGNYDDCLMRIAVSRVQMPRPTFETLGGFRGPNNCQVWAELVRLEYAKLRDDEEAKCTCGMN